MKFHRKISLRYLRSRRGFISVVSSFSLIGIALGVAALIVVMAVMAGFREELMGRILGISGHATLIAPYSSVDDGKIMRSGLIKIPEVKSVESFVQGQAMMMSRGSANGVIVRGIDSSFFLDNSALDNSAPDNSALDNNDLNQTKFVIENNIILGDLSQLSKKNRVVIGKGLARELAVSVGSTVTLISPQGSQTIAGFIPRMQKFKVVAIFDIGMDLYDTGWVYTSMQSAQRFYRLGDMITGLEIKVNDPNTIESYRRAFSEIAGESSQMISWRDNNRQFFDALQVERVAMFIILSLLVVVAAFNIITSQTMLVNDKKSDIAIMRTMGATRGDILRIFFTNGSLLGFIGTGIGLICGLLIIQFLQPIVAILEATFGVSIFSGEAYFLDKLPAIIIWSDVGVVLLMSVTLSMLASIYPAWRASLLDPVEILRNE